LPSNWHLERYRALLKVQVRQLELDPRLRVRFDSSDLVQETLLHALRGLPDFRGKTEGELIAWLSVILAHVAADAVEKAHAGKRDVGRERSLQDVVASSSARLEHLLASREPSPPEAAQRNEDLLRLAEAIEELHADQRDAFIQVRLLGLSRAEVARSMGRTEAAVASLVFRAITRLGQVLCEDPS
jgi:RNA polymerase sigma-70 factor (ECF subfamily)